jgi:hypothetical protein
MDGISRSALPPPDERVDIPEIQESTRVSFSQGAAVHRGSGARAGTDL